MRDQDRNLGFSDGISSNGTVTPIAKNAEQLNEFEDTPSEVDENDLLHLAPTIAETQFLQPPKDTPRTVYVDPSNSERVTDSADVEANSTAQKDEDEGSEIKLERELDKLFLGAGRTKKEPV